jgi:hypothetical protein
VSTVAAIVIVVVAVLLLTMLVAGGRRARLRSHPDLGPDDDVTESRSHAEASRRGDQRL